VNLFINSLKADNLKQEKEKEKVTTNKEVKVDLNKSRFKASSTATSQFKDINNLDSINIDELSCRPRTVTNVGLDYIINTDFKQGKASFYR